MDNTQDLSKLPPPPTGQQGVTFASLQHLPPPPTGQQGFTLDQIPGATAQKSTSSLIDNPITRGIQSIFPGKQIGTGIGNTISGVTQAIKTHSLAPLSEAADANNQMAPKIFGDAANAGLTAAAPTVGGESALGRIGANTALGGGIGTSNAISQGDSAKDVLKEGVTGGALGGGATAGSELAGYLSKNMPQWFTKLALPKLSNSKLNGAPEDVVNYALNNTKGATLKSMYGNSNSSVSNYEKQIQTVLGHPDYAGETGGVKDALDHIQGQHSNAQLDNSQIVNILKQVAPNNKSIVDKVVSGNATLAEQNALRKELDSATKKVYTDHPELTFNKSIGKTAADFLRKNVQNTAKETQPIFSNYSKELALNKALTGALSKKRVAGPLVAGVGGFAGGGLKGAAEAVAVEEGLRSPTAKLLAGKAIQGATKYTAPVGRALVQGGKAPLIKKLTSQ